MIMRAESADAIAVRILDNPLHYSSLHWYQSQNFTGSPQLLQIDGYEAVRNGRTVYIDVANIADKNNDGLPDFFDTNIFVISYNQDAQGVTSDIFGQLVKNFKFNTNLTELGTCNKTITTVCLSDTECPVGEYCGSQKAKVIRDVKRLADLEEIKSQLDNYKQNNNNNYPKLLGGTYLAGKTLSTWPSWQQSLGQELGVTLPVDPINQLGTCASNFDPITCWDKDSKKFPTDLSQLMLPAGSHIYLYSINDLGNLVKYCTQIESGYANLQAFNCLNEKRINNQPIIKDVNLTGRPNKEFIGYVSVADIDGDPIKLSVDLVSPISSVWASRRWQWDTGLNKFSVSSSPEPGQRKIHAVKTGTTGNPGYYQVKLTVDDGQGAANSTYSQIYDVKVSPIPPILAKNEKTIAIGSNDVMNVYGTDSNGDPLTSLLLDSASFNNAPLSQAALESNGFTLKNMNLTESFKSPQHTGVYIANVYAIDPNITSNRIDSVLTYTIVNNPPVFQKLTATFSNNTIQVCEPNQKCSIAIDNSEAAKIEIKGTDPDGHNVNYSLVDNFGGKLVINSTGLITGLEKLNFQQLTEQSFNIVVKIADSYCNNSNVSECSSLYSFDLLVENYCSLNIPESTIQISKPGPFTVNKTGDKLETGLTLTDCSAIGSSSIDVKFIGESHSQAIVLVSDLSGSMATDVYSGGTTEVAVSRLIKALTTTNTGFFDKIYNTALKLPVEFFTKISLVAFNSSVISFKELTNIVSAGSLASLKNVVNNYSARSATNTLLGLNKAEESLAGIDDQSIEKIVILMSDGIPAVDGYKDTFSCTTPHDPTCDCGGPYPGCSTPPTCTTGNYYNRTQESNGSITCGCVCTCGGTYPNCNVRPNCNYYTEDAVNIWQVKCECVPKTCDSCNTNADADKSSPPDCRYPDSGPCGLDYSTCKPYPDTCHSVFNTLFEKTLGLFNIFKPSPVLAATTQTTCVSTCKTPTTCPLGQNSYCYASGPIANCDITPDVNTEATALKNSGVTLYTIYYNTSGAVEPKQKMCNWSSNNGTSCELNTFAFAGTDIDTMINKVLSRIITKPKEVMVGSTSITDSETSTLTSYVNGAVLDGLLCGGIKPIVTYTNDGYLEFSNLKLNYCGAKLHP